MRILSPIALATLATSVLSCSADGLVARERSDQSAQGIYYGSLDTTHQAVVAVYSGSGMCSGTIVAVNGSTGYVLTAAHCLTGGGSSVLPANQFLVLMGNDYNNYSASFDVAQVAIHPLYDFSSGSANDFGMMRIVGASGVPTIPAMTPAQDTLAVGTQVDLIGYGVTQTSSSNTKRYHIVKPIADLYSAWLVFDQTGTSGGTCSGDSGGPAITTSGTVAVAGVTSFGTGANCLADGYSGRVSTVYSSFIKPFIDGTTGTLSCVECDNAATAGNGACVSTVQACFNDTGCSSFYDCLVGCSDAACQNQCVASNPAGADMYFAISDCICSSCSTECASDPMCAQPTCGFSLTDATCDSCSDSACCSQEQACADDSVCPSCLSSSPPASCSSNGAYDAYLTCLGSQCATECGVSSCGFSSSDATCDACLSGSCCAEGGACAADATCNSCIVDTPTPAGCDTNALANAFLGCLDTHCSTECGGGGTGGTGGAGGTGGSAGTGGTAGMGGTGGSATGGTGGTGTGGDAGTGGVAGSGATGGAPGTGGVAGDGGAAGAPSTGGATGTPGASSDTSGDSGGCAMAPAGRGTSSALLALALGALLGLRRRRS